MKLKEKTDVKKHHSNILRKVDTVLKHIDDLREDAPGLLGLELDLSWDSSISSIEDRFSSILSLFIVNV